MCTALLCAPLRRAPACDACLNVVRTRYTDAAAGIRKLLRGAPLQDCSQPSCSSAHRAALQTRQRMTCTCMTSCSTSECAPRPTRRRAPSPVTCSRAHSRWARSPSPPTGWPSPTQCRRRAAGTADCFSGDALRLPSGSWVEATKRISFFSCSLPPEFCQRLCPDIAAQQPPHPRARRLLFLILPRCLGPTITFAVPGAIAPRAHEARWGGARACAGAPTVG